MTDPAVRLHHRTAEAGTTATTESAPEEESPLGLWLTLGAGLAALGATLFGPWLGVAIGALLLAIPVVHMAKRGQRIRHRRTAALPLVVEAVARSMRSGATLTHALAEFAASDLGALRPDIAAIVREANGGRPLSNCLEAWSDREATPQTRIVAAAFAFAAQNDAGSAQVLDGVGQSLRDRLALEDEIEALTAQASASLRAMVGLPLLFLAVDGLFGQRALVFLAGSAFGRLCLIAGISLEVIGWWWMRRLVRST